MKRIFILIFFISALFSTNVIAQLQDSSEINQQYHLGEISIVGHKNTGTLVTKFALEQNKQNLGEALNLLPSVSFNHAGSRNETGVYVKGFDLRAVPVFIDGVPVYIPYDGLIDLSHFKSGDYSKIDVSSGLTPMEFGSNTLGGAINLVTKKPVKKLEADAFMGAESGQGLSYGFNLGTKLEKFYFLGGYLRQQQKYVPLSKNYERLSRNEDGGERENSFSLDNSLKLKVGFTPNKTDEYSVSFSILDGTKGVPPYSGDDPLVKARFWQWPVWKKQNLYFIGKTRLGEKSLLKTRLNFDKFDNKLKSFNDSTYTLQTKPYAFTSYYNDYSLGGGISLQSELLKYNTLCFTLNEKYDVHQEHNEGEIARSFIDNTFNLGLDDVIKLNQKWQIVAGLAYNLRQGLKAQDYNSATKTISDYAKNSNSNLNGQIACKYQFTEKNIVTVFVAHRSRFATMKDRYSYKMGIAIPNPELKSEQANHYEIDYQHTFIKKISLQTSLYYIHLQDAIQSVSNVQPGKSQMQNVGFAEFTGVDLSLDYRITEKFKFNASYSYIERKNLTHPEIKFTDVPVHKLMGNLELKLIKHVSILANAEYNSSRYSTSYGTKAEAFELYNLYISTDVIKGFTLRTGINNILDKNYCYSEGYPAEGRNLFVSLSYKFAK